MAVDVGTINFTINNNLCYLWQYDNAFNLTSLMNFKDNFLTICVQNFWEDFFQNIFNIQTANTFGLELWGETLGIARPQYTNSDNETVYFTDNMYRKLLLASILKFNSNASVASINDFLRFFFGSENKPVLFKNNYDMTAEIVFYYLPTLEDMAVFNNPDFLPLPTGVEIKKTIIDQNSVFGFNGSGLTGFNTGTFVG